MFLHLSRRLGKLKLAKLNLALNPRSAGHGICSTVSGFIQSHRSGPTHGNADF